MHKLRLSFLSTALSPLVHKGSACLALPLLGILLLAGCSNSPYPEEGDTDETVYYSSFSSPPSDLDPQRSYTSADGSLLAHCYESLLGYNYLQRPLVLQPELATAIPKPQITKDANGTITEVRYSFSVQKDVSFLDDACFPGGKGREMKATDFEYAFMRVADSTVNCPVFDSFAHISGLREYRKKIDAIREEMTKAAVAAGTEEDDLHLSTREIYNKAGKIPGIQVTGDHSLDVVMDHAYPQMLYWLAMRFVCAIPHEAVDFYNGQFGTLDDNGHPMEIAQRPVGTGPYQFDWTRNRRESRIVLIRNPNWWGLKYPERKAPVAIMPPTPGEDRDTQIGAWSPELAGKPLSPPDRIDLRLERESLPRFNKFLQGYYDAAPIPIESFNTVIQGDGLTPEMQERGIRLVKDVSLDIRYIGFNMDDDQIGAPVKFADPALEKKREAKLDSNRKVRQALNLAIDIEEYLRIFSNKLGEPAQSLIPPGIFGYDPDYKNPYRQYDPELIRAKELLAEAGFPNGIDPETGQPLKLAFVGGNTTTIYRTICMWFIDSWKRLGINVELQLSDYNKFQDKMHEGNYQIFMWGWLADYPDPENFLFLCYGPNSGKYNPHNPGHARYENPRYDFLFKKMEAMRNTESKTWTETSKDGKETTVTMTRGEIIKELVNIFAEDCPWVPLNHSEDYILYHDWATGIKPHAITGGWYRNYRIDHDLRVEKRKAWNKPILWPIPIIILLVILFIVPAVRTIYRERR